MSAGAMTGGAAKQDSSKSRMVALSIARTLSMADADEWMASKASLLNLCLVAMTNLRKIAVFQKLFDLTGVQALVGFGELAKPGQFLVIDVGLIALRK